MNAPKNPWSAFDPAGEDIEGSPNALADLHAQARKIRGHPQFLLGTAERDKEEIRSDGINMIDDRRHVYVVNISVLCSSNRESREFLPKFVCSPFVHFRTGTEQKDAISLLRSQTAEAWHQFGPWHSFGIT